MNASASLSPVHVACAADAAYALPLAVMLASVDRGLAASRGLVVHVADDGLTPRDRELVAASLSARCALHWIPARAWTRSQLPTWGRMPATTYLKLSLAEWLPADLDRVLWLDCDLLVLADVTGIWTLATGEHIALAARDPLVPRLAARFGVAAWRELGLDPGAGYFNAGVLLVDLARWRAEGVAERAADYLRRFGDRVVFWDQEALNAALAGRWAELDPRWNRNPTLHRLFAPRATEDAPWIAHFSGRLKPWTCPVENGHQAEFEACLDATAWAGTRPRRSWRRALVARYAVSPLRRRLFPLEQWWTAAACRLTRQRIRRA